MKCFPERARKRDEVRFPERSRFPNEFAVQCGTRERVSSSNHEQPAVSLKWETMTDRGLVVSTTHTFGRKLFWSKFLFFLFVKSFEQKRRRGLTLYCLAYLFRQLNRGQVADLLGHEERARLDVFLGGLEGDVLLRVAVEYAEEVVVRARHDLPE